MNAEIIAVGTELLMGQISNTNAQYISAKLNELGINIYFHSVVGDNEKRILEVIDIALNRSDIVIMTGGLGPTMDDMTKEVVAKKFGRKLILDEKSLGKIEKYFLSVGKKMTENNKKQALYPEESTILDNLCGTAPGIIVENLNKYIILLPGPPREMKSMFENSVIPFLKEKTNSTITSKFVKIFNVGESFLEEELKELINNQDRVTIAPYAHEGEVTLRVSVKTKIGENPDEYLSPIINEIMAKFGDNIYSLDGEDVYNVVGRILLDNKITVSTVESCTGGLISGLITSIPGISSIYNMGFVTYSNEAKKRLVGVSNENLAKYGAVSMEVAIEMAEGVKKVSNADIGLSVTGIAGPGGGTKEKPVGLVYIAIATNTKTEWFELRLNGNRDKIRRMSALHLLFNLYRILKNSLGEEF